jgi:charged multivesicular body protein 2A
MASMNRGLNLPGIQKIMNDFEKESSMMDMKETMMSETIDEVMDQEEDEEEEGDKILKEVLDEIGVSLAHQVGFFVPFFARPSADFHQLTDAPTGVTAVTSPLTNRQPVAIGESLGQQPRIGDDKSPSNGSGAGGMSDEDALQARLDALRKP